MIVEKPVCRFGIILASRESCLVALSSSGNNNNKNKHASLAIAERNQGRKNSTVACHDWMKLVLRRGIAYLFAGMRYHHLG